MNRREKYPDTKTFRFHNANPKNRYTTDCVVRAISTALELPYSQVLMEMAEFQIKSGYAFNSNEGMDGYLKSKGWKKNKQPRKDDNTKYTGKEWCKEITARQPDARMVANIGGGHTVAIVGGKVHDTWDSTGGSIGIYWTKE